MRVLITLLLILHLSACGKMTMKPAQNPAAGTVSTECVIGPESAKYSDPKSISELLTLINSLPKPLELDCLLKSLKRPLYFNATSSILSVQPADGPRNPRIFIFKEPLIISFVPNGEGSRILEFSELTSNIRSIKGELSLPVTATVDSTDPFKRIIKEGSKTTCSGCHVDERVEYFDGEVPVLSSEALKPSASKDVDKSSLQYEVTLCAFYKDRSKRCRILEALFSEGEVYSKSFPKEMRTLLNSFGG